jgi:CheY-like chemotaxis protein
MATTLVDILNIKGFEVYAAQSGAEALEILREHAVDILLTDVKMPDMNGVELYREARKIYPNLTTFLMTAYAADGIIQQGMAEGIRTVLNKPLNIDFLLTLFSVTMGFITKED